MMNHDTRTNLQHVERFDPVTYGFEDPPPPIKLAAKGSNTHPPKQSRECFSCWLVRDDCIPRCVMQRVFELDALTNTASKEMHIVSRSSCMCFTADYPLNCSTIFTKAHKYV
mmetsp:Transcript_6822/g.12958  ORF Transcript_6822/g.12958 Transcript_6822/m.12958 type:complete len:112 (-) Transcript_6822:50-385(-)